MLHGLIERVGNLGVQTIEDLSEFSRRVSPQRRAKRTWAADLPERPGVYLFVAEHDSQRHVLYVGKSKNIRTRVRTYFTAAEKRPRIDEMVRLATGVEAVPVRHPAAGRRHRAAADRQSRPALQPPLEVPRAHPVDQDHRGGLSRGCRWSESSGTTAPPTSDRSPAGRRPRTSCWPSTTDSRSGSAPHG